MNCTPSEPEISYLHGILGSTEPVKAKTNLEKLIFALGYGGFAFGTLWGDTSELAGEATFCGGNLSELTPDYVSNGLVAVDPLAHALRTAQEPVFWGPYLDFGNAPGASRAEKHLHALRSKHGITSGVSIPLEIAAIGCRAALSVSGVAGVSQPAFNEIFKRDGPTLHLAALALGYSLAPLLHPPKAVELSVSEKAVLEALGKGLRPREIAVKLGKSEHTVRNQIVSAQRRLDARTKEEALIVAVRMGLITL